MSQRDKFSEQNYKYMISVIFNKREILKVQKQYYIVSVIHIEKHHQLVTLMLVILITSRTAVTIQTEKKALFKTPVERKFLPYVAKTMVLPVSSD